MDWPSIEHNQFSGDFDSRGLRRTLQNLLIKGNKFHGSPVFADLPDVIVNVDLSDNKFCGIADMSELRGMAEEIDVSGDMLEEVVNVTRWVNVLTDGTGSTDKRSTDTGIILIGLSDILSVVVWGSLRNSLSIGIERLHGDALFLHISFFE